MDKCIGFWQVYLTAAAKELLAFTCHFGVANAPSLFQQLMHLILCILRRRPLVQELIPRSAEMEGHINDVS